MQNTKLNLFFKCEICGFSKYTGVKHTISGKRNQKIVNFLTQRLIDKVEVNVLEETWNKV